MFQIINTILPNSLEQSYIWQSPIVKNIDIAIWISTNYRNIYTGLDEYLVSIENINLLDEARTKSKISHKSCIKHRAMTLAIIREDFTLMQQLECKITKNMFLLSIHTTVEIAKYLHTIGKIKEIYHSFVTDSKEMNEYLKGIGHTFVNTLPSMDPLSILNDHDIDWKEKMWTLHSLKPEKRGYNHQINDSSDY
jgi:hypothetical protein